MNEHSAEERTCLADLILLWQRRRADGETVTPAELCRERPEFLPALERQIAALQQIDALDQDTHETVTIPPQIGSAESVNAAAPLDPHATLPPSGQEFAPPAPAALLDAPHVPEYEIVGELGRGGMGVVYKARQRGLGRVVALKMILHAEHASEQERQRFQAEAEAVARLQHPNIVQIYEVGEHHGLPYFSLEFCAGGSLEAKLAGTPLTPLEAAKLVQTLSEAMQAAHDKGVLHRDLKPANVLLSEDGTPKITDFGLAKKLGEKGQTQTGAIMGTPSYMAPEQAGGKSKDIGPAADIYALGAILYELLTGRPPFKAATALDTIMQVVSEEPVSVRQLQPRVPRDIETICLKCLQKEPTRRYASAADLAEDLRRFHNELPIAARPISRFERGWRWCRRNPALALSAAAVVIILTAGSIVSTYFGIEARQSAETAREREQDAREGERKAQEALEDLNSERGQSADYRYATSINRAYAEWQAHNNAAARHILELCPGELRGWEWDFLKSIFDEVSMPLRGHAGTVLGIAFTPDGNRVCTFGVDSTVRIWDARSGVELRTIQQNARRMALSPDGRSLAVATANEHAVVVYEVDSGREVSRFNAGEPACGLAFVRGGKELVVVTLDGQVTFRDPVTGAIRSRAARKLQLDSQTVGIWSALGQGVAISQDGERLAQGGGDTKVRVWNAASGELVLEGTGEPRLVCQVAFRPDGKQVAAPGLEGEIHIWDLETKKVVRTLRGHRSWVWSVAYSGDGKRLISASKDSTARVWEVESGRELLTLNGHDGEVWAAAFAGNSNRAGTASPDGTARLWDVAERVFNGEPVAKLLKDKQADHLGLKGGLEYLTFYSHGDSQGPAILSPDGRYLVATMLSFQDLPNHLCIWDLDSRQIARQIKVPGAVTVAPTFAHDGRGLLAGAALAYPGPSSHVRRYSFPEGKQLWEWTGPPAGMVVPALSTDGNVLVVLERANVHGIYSPAPNSPDLLVGLDPQTGAERYRETLGTGLLGPAFTRDGREVLLGDALSGEVKVFDPTTGKLVRKWQASTFPLSAVACGAGPVAATSDELAVITLWDLRDGSELRKLEGHVGSVMSITFSPDGKRLLSCASDLTARIWNVETGRELLNFRDHTHAPIGVAWSKDGSRLATACLDGAVRVWQGPAPRSDAYEDWPILVRDDFQRQELGSRWKPTMGSWDVQDGRLIGHQQQFDSPTMKFPVATAALQDVQLPNHFEARFRYQSPKPLAMSAILSSPYGGSSILVQPILAGRCKMAGAPTALVQLITQINPKVEEMKFSSIGLPRAFDAEPGRWHEVRLLREPDRLRVWADGRPVIHERIPEVELPNFSLGGSWADVGDTIEIADFEVRAPASAIRTSALRARVRKEFAQLKLREEVRRRFEADSTPNADERAFLSRLIDALVEDEADLEMTSFETVRKSGKSKAEYTLALRQIEATVRLGPSTDHLRTLGLAQVRCGLFADAVRTLKKSIAMSREERGSALPSHYAALAMAYHSLGQPKETREAYQQLDVMLQGDHWRGDRGVVKELVEETRALVGPEAKVDPEVAQLTKVIARAEQDGWLKHRLDNFLALYTDDATLTVGRFEQPDRHDVTLGRKQLESIRRLQFRSPPLSEGKLIFSWEDVRAEVRKNTAEWRCRWTMQTGGLRSYESFYCVYRLIRTGDGWRVHSLRLWPLAEKKGGLHTAFDRAWYAEHDRAADALPDSEPLAKVDALREARRPADAYQLARAAAERPSAAADLWAKRGELAFTLGDVPDVLASFRKAEELNPEAKLPGYLSRLRRVFEEHGERGVGAVVHVPPDGRLLFSADFDGFGRLWDRGSGREVKHFEVAGETLAGGAVSRDGKHVAVGGTNVHVWDVETNKVQWVGKGHTKIVYRLHFRGDGQRLVSASADGTARVWDVATGKELLAFRQHNRPVFGAEFSPDGRLVVSCGDDTLARLWDAETGEQIRTFRGHTAGLKRAVFSPDGRLLATASQDHTVRLWDVATGKELRKLLGHDAVVDVVAFSLDGTTLASGDFDGRIRLWDAATGKLRRVLADYPSQIYSLSFRPDGQELAVAGAAKVHIFAVGPLQ